MLEIWSGTGCTAGGDGGGAWAGVVLVGGSPTASGVVVTGAFAGRLVCRRT